MRLLIVRHADPDYAGNTITPAGHLEALALARRMAAIRPDRLYCSPLGRAIHTAQYTADALHLPLNIEGWTQELGTALSATPPNWGSQGGRLMAWDVPGEVIRAHDPLPTAGDWSAREPFTDPSFRAAFEELQKNSDAFLARHGYVREDHRYRIAAANREKIAVFCHGGFGLTWLAHLLDIPLTLVWSGFWLAPSSITTVLFDERSAEWATPRVIGAADTSHLYEAGLPIQHHGIKANTD